MSYGGGNDGAVVIIQYGDATIDQTTASGYQASFSHTYTGTSTFKVDAEVFAGGCLAPCRATATVVNAIAIEHCWDPSQLPGFCTRGVSISVPGEVPNAAPTLALAIRSS